MPTADLAATVASFPGVSNVRSCTLTVRGVAYAAVRYHYVGLVPQGSRAWSEGRREYEEERFYVLGHAPEHGCVAFTMCDEPNEWFVAGYADERVTGDARYAQFHPLGPWWGLHEWTHEDAIDTFEPCEYTRVELEVSYADA